MKEWGNGYKLFKTQATIPQLSAQFSWPQV